VLSVVIKAVLVARFMVHIITIQVVDGAYNIIVIIRIRGLAVKWQVVSRKADFQPHQDRFAAQAFIFLVIRVKINHKILAFHGFIRGGWVKSMVGGYIIHMFGKSDA
jgi:hypothetical protein